MDRASVKRFLETTNKPRILVVGDIILDEYWWGNINRISPEAPVSVVDLATETFTLGGAGNVAKNLSALGSQVALVGVIGADEKGDKIKKSLADLNIDSQGVIVDPGRPTISKIRIMAQNQQVIRVDREERKDVSPEISMIIMNSIRESLSSVSGVIVSDYNKGLLNKEILRSIITECRLNNKKIFVDPKGRDFSKYCQANYLTPNKREAEIASGITIHTEEDLVQVAKTFINYLSLEGLLITRGREGMSLFAPGTEPIHIPAQIKEVYDVTGAGDTVISVFSYLILADADPLEAAKIANLAAGIVVGKLGAAVPQLAEILNFVDGERDKVILLEELLPLIARKRTEGRRIVFTNGCFDLLHVGHIKYLQKAKKMGDILIVGLNSDTSVKALKGINRPLISEKERAQLLAALDCIDHIVLFSELTPLNLISKIKPDILIKGGDYRPEEVVGKEIVDSYGGKVELVPYLEGFSTSQIISEILTRYRP